MWGWSSWEASLISRRNRSAATLTSSSGWRILSATGWPSGLARQEDAGVPALPDLALDLVAPLESLADQRQHVAPNAPVLVWDSPMVVT